ncbi:zinc ribbon domain-containing protein [Planctomycetota bacterium]|nr:zinc ribbon domain-containing protein [Planctomycetota bacterium]
MIKFSCDCGQAIRVPEEYAGKRAKCQKCGAIQRVPEAVAVGDDMGLLNDAISSKAASSTAVTKAGPTCGHCGSEVREGAKLCLSCGGLIDGKKLKTKIKKDGAKEQAARAAGSLAIALVVGGIIAVIGGSIWAGITIVTNYEIGYVAWGIGLLVGLAVATAAGTQSFAVGTYAAGLAALGLLIGKLMIFQWGATGELMQMYQDNEVAQTVSVVQMMHEENEFSEPVMSALEESQNAEENGEELELPEKLEKKLEEELDAKLDSMSKDELRQAVKDYFVPAVLEDVSYSDRISNSFSPWDFLWFGLALFTAFRVGAGGTE